MGKSVIPSAARLNVSTFTPVPNQTVGRYCPASLSLCMRRTHAVLRYAPMNPIMVNLDTSNSSMSDSQTVYLPYGVAG